jgi:hypothetical protein
MQIEIIGTDLFRKFPINVLEVLSESSFEKNLYFWYRFDNSNYKIKYNQLRGSQEEAC